MKEYSWVGKVDGSKEASHGVYGHQGKPRVLQWHGGGISIRGLGQGQLLTGRWLHMKDKYNSRDEVKEGIPG